MNFVENAVKNQEVSFCGMIEPLPSSTSSESRETQFVLSEPPNAILATGSNFSQGSETQVQLNESGVRNLQSDYMRSGSSVFDLFYFENFICNSTPKKAIEESTCATLDTGCQRSVIGINNLESLGRHLPDRIIEDPHKRCQQPFQKWSWSF